MKFYKRLWCRIVGHKIYGTFLEDRIISGSGLSAVHEVTNGKFFLSKCSRYGDQPTVPKESQQKQASECEHELIVFNNGKIICKKCDSDQTEHWKAKILES